MDFLNEWRGEETDYLDHAEECFTLHIILLSSTICGPAVYEARFFSFLVT